jgi:hypothetical protein
MKFTYTTTQVELAKDAIKEHGDNAIDYANDVMEAIDYDHGGAAEYHVWEEVINCICDLQSGTEFITTTTGE